MQVIHVQIHLLGGRVRITGETDKLLHGMSSEVVLSFTDFGRLKIVTPFMIDIRWSSNGR